MLYKKIINYEKKFKFQTIIFKFPFESYEDFVNRMIDGAPDS